jgi:hypothetical protein
MFRGSKLCRCPGSPGGQAAEGSRNGACTSSPWTGTASRSITSSATRTGAPATTASFRPYPALTVTCRVPAGVASPTRAAAVPERSSGTSSPAGSMSTAVTATPAACSSRAAVSSNTPTPASTASLAGRSSSHHSNLKSRPGSHTGTAR